MKTSDYLDALKERYKLSTDGDVMRLMGWQRSQTSHYRRCRHTFDQDVSVQVADRLGLDRAQVMVDMEMQRAKSPEVRATWARVAARLSTAAALVALIGAAAFGALPHLSNNPEYLFAAMGYTGSALYDCILC